MARSRIVHNHAGFLTTSLPQCNSPTINRNPGRTCTAIILKIELEQA